MSSVLADFVREAPPISRVIASLTFLTSIGVYLFGIISIESVFFHPYFITKLFPPQLWRLVSSFCLTSPKMGILFDTFFLYRDASQCEKKFPRTGDFFVFTAFLWSIILVLNYFVVGGALFVVALNVAYAYYWTSQENAATNFNFILANFSVRYLPYVMLLILTITQGPDQFYVGLTGLLAAHLYIFLTHVYPTYAQGTNLIVTPNFVHRWFEGNRAPSTAPPGVGSASGTSTARASSTGFDSVWRQRGGGQRLGSE